MSRSPSKKPRIAILGSRGWPSTYGGFETLVRHLAPHLASQGFETAVYCRDPRRPLAWMVAELEGVQRVFTPGLDRKTTSTLSFGFTATLDATLRGYDALLILNVAHGFFLPLLRIRGIPVVVNVDGLEWERAKWNRMGASTFLAGARMVARFANEIVIDSHAVGTRWRELFGRDGTFIPYGAEIIDPRPTCNIAALGLMPRSYVLVVARLVPENNIDLILDAIERLPQATQVVMVGDANYRSPLTERLLRLSARRRELRWLGHLDDQELLTDLWAHCGIYVHGHSAGGTNPALVQALGARCPTVAFDTPFNREVLGRRDQLFRSSEDLAELIGSVLGSVESRESLARRGPEIVRTRYTWESVLEAYTTLLTRMVDGAAQGTR